MSSPFKNTPLGSWKYFPPHFYLPELFALAAALSPPGGRFFVWFFPPRKFFPGVFVDLFALWVGRDRSLSFPSFFKGFLFLSPFHGEPGLLYVFFACSRPS